MPIPSTNLAMPESDVKPALAAARTNALQCQKQQSAKATPATAESDESQLAGSETRNHKTRWHPKITHSKLIDATRSNVAYFQNPHLRPARQKTRAWKACHCRPCPTRGRLPEHASTPQSATSLPLDGVGGGGGRAGGGGGREGFINPKP